MPLERYSPATRCDTPNRQKAPSSRVGAPERASGLRGDDGADDGVAGRDVLELGLDLGPVEQLGHATLAVARDERHDGSLLACSAGAAGAVQVRLVLVGGIRLDHEVDVVDVD